MTTAPTSVFVTWHALCPYAFYQRTAKIAVLLWDELLLELPHPRMIERIFEVIASEEGTGFGAVDALRKQLRPVHARIPDFQFLNVAGWEQYTNSGAVDAMYREWLAEVGRGELDPGDFAHQYEANKLAYYGVNTLHTWAGLLRHGTQLLGHPAEERGFRNAIRRGEASSSASPFLEMTFGALPDLGSLTWSQALELRAHPMHQSFRAKCLEVSELLDAGITTDAARLLTDALQFSLREIVRRVRPNIGTTMLKAVLGNVPLPFPVNPVSVLASAQEVAQQRAIAATHGWVYFILDAEERLAAGGPVSE